MVFAHLTLEQALLLSDDSSAEVDLQIALWTDVVGHCANDIRFAGTSPARVLVEGEGMMAARLRILAVQSDGAKSVICLIRAASTA